ncbi:MAG: hypothetical protein P4L84_04100 [Isosphaeraceae bacterium]|nr:hypothetical protein [Isosphaeraceae bacterium]
MIAVTVVGIAMGAIILYQKSLRCQRLAKQYRSLEAIFNAEAVAAHAALLQGEAKLRESEAMRDCIAPQPARASKLSALIAASRRADAARKVRAEALVERDRASVEATRQRENTAQQSLTLFSSLSRKYERAARYPWLPVPPDPPPPK